MANQMTNIDDWKAYSAFFALPAELRIRIYCQALSSTITIAENRGPCEESEPNLLLTCKQIRSEAAEIFYATASFRFPAKYGSDILIKEWLASLKPEYTKVVRHLELYMDIDLWRSGKLGCRKPVSTPLVKCLHVKKLRKRAHAVLPGAESISTNIWLPKQSVVDSLRSIHVLEACRGDRGEMECVWTNDPVGTFRGEVARIWQVAAERERGDGAEGVLAAGVTV